MWQKTLVWITIVGIASLGFSGPALAEWQTRAYKQMERSVTDGKPTGAQRMVQNRQLALQAQAAFVQANAQRRAVAPGQPHPRGKPPVAEIDANGDFSPLWTAPKSDAFKFTIPPPGSSKTPDVYRTIRPPRKPGYYTVPSRPIAEP